MLGSYGLIKVKTVGELIALLKEQPEERKLYTFGGHNNNELSPVVASQLVLNKGYLGEDKTEEVVAIFEDAEIMYNKEEK